VAGAAVTDIASAGNQALVEALLLFHRDVYDPPVSDQSAAGNASRHVIEEICTSAGWIWEVPYKGINQVEWCGLFAGACWHAAGLDPKWLATYFASTYRIDAWANYEAFDAKHPNPRPKDGPYRLIANLDQSSTTLPFTPMPGDILMIGDGHPAFGQHITIVESYAAGVFSTISGNGIGLGPDGKRRRGIVRAAAHLGGGGYCARRLVRPSVGDLLI